MGKRERQRQKKAARKNATKRMEKHRAGFKIDKIASVKEKDRTRKSKSRDVTCNTPGGHSQHLAQQRRDTKKCRSKRKAAEEETASRLKYVPVPPFPPPTSSNRKGSTVYVSVGSSLVLSKASVEQTGASVAGLSVDHLSPVEQTEHINRGRGIR